MTSRVCVVAAWSALLAAVAMPSPLAASGDAADAAAQVPDLCNALVDPYDQAGEKVRFFAAAGVDGELDAKELEANRTADDPFARARDTWPRIAPFDKDGNKTIDWFEADAYRRAIREAVLKAFDADKDGRLTGEERSKANRALASGNVDLPAAAVRPRAIAVAPPVPAGGAAAVPGAGAADPPHPRSADFDTDGDGKLSAEERKAYTEAWRAYTREAYRRRTAKYDTDGDGKLSDEERKAWYDAMRESSMAAYRQRIAQYDTDGDGKLSDDERRRMMAAQEVKWRDKDGDGAVSRDEWTTGSLASLTTADGRVSVRLDRLWDRNRDGQLDEKEKAAKADFESRMGERRKQQAEEFDKADADEDGKVTAGELAALRKAQQTERIRKYDADGNGTLSAEERSVMVWDRDHDGKLSPEEAQRKADAEKRMQQWRERLRSRTLGDTGA